MLFKKNGTSFKLDTKNKTFIIKIAAALVLSNIFFFILFSPSDEIEEKSLSDNEVEIHLQVTFHTSFQKGKKVLLIHRKTQRMVEAKLQDWVNEETQTLSVSVQDTQAQRVIDLTGWEVVPYIKQYTFAQTSKGDQYEIRY